MLSIPLPSFNVDTLEGATLHMLSVCGALSDSSINQFTSKYAYLHGKRLPRDYGSTVLLQRLRRDRKVFRTAQHLYSLNPQLRCDWKALDAFWVFLEHMESVDLSSVWQPRSCYGQITYIKNNSPYNIIRCEKNGVKELSTIVEREIHLSNVDKRDRYYVTQKYIFIFGSEEEMLAAPLIPQGPTLFSIITYSDPALPPHLSFIDPKILPVGRDKS